MCQFILKMLCEGKRHWALYVVLHITHSEDYPYMQTSVIREILFQYCEVWSTHDSQWRFIESLGVPSSWLHEALQNIQRYGGLQLPCRSEIEDWDLGARIFISFYVLRSSLQQDNDTMTELALLRTRMMNARILLSA